MNQSLLAKSGWRIIQGEDGVVADGELVMVVIFYFGLITGNVVHKIASLHVGSGTDKLIWGGSSKGEFSVKIAYGVGMDCEDTPWQWRFIWNLKLSSKILAFLWTLLHEKLLTNVQRVTRGLTRDPSCPRCHLGDESIEHLIRDCRVSMDVWVNACARAFFISTFVFLLILIC
ncbi:hypothetical protein ACOSQ2_019336 [Xanthoceras sorbifolium]